MSSPEFYGCHAEMIFHVFAKERGIWKREYVADLLDTIICLTQVVADVFQNMFRNPFVGGFAGTLLADSRQVFGRDTEFAGVCFYRVAFHVVGVQQVEKTLEVAVAR